LKTEVTDSLEWLCTAFLKISMLFFIPYFLVMVFVCHFLGFILMALGSITSVLKKHLIPSACGLSGDYTVKSQGLISDKNWLEDYLWHAIVVIAILLYGSYFFLPHEQKTLTASYQDKGSGLNGLQMIVKAAGRGDVAAQIHLGKKYQNGMGVSQDFKEAEKWYSKAANQGSTNAQHHLYALEKEWCNFVAQEQTCYLSKISNTFAKPAKPNIIFSNQMRLDEVFVQGYMRKNGTYVQAHRRTKADKTSANNWSSLGNINPYTGKRGYKR
jgi:hypothetical protein